MIVLDADSVMSGETIVEMARRMDAGRRDRHPASAAAAGESRLAVCPLPAVRGSRLWSDLSGRFCLVDRETTATTGDTTPSFACKPSPIRADFRKLPGLAPLGGEILSHDFVEAALMRRAGWKVCLAHDLEGSYEECPPTLIDYAQRDQSLVPGQHAAYSAGLLHAAFIRSAALHFGMGAIVVSFVAAVAALLSFELSVAAEVVVGRSTPADDARLVGGSIVRHRDGDVAVAEVVEL